MQHFIKYAAFILLVLLTGIIVAQKTTVKGVVFDKATGEPLPFVNLSFKNSKVGTISDVNGAYYISTYYATDSLVVSYVGYTKMTKKVRKDVTQVIDFYLESGSVEMEEVVIKYKGNPADIIFERIIKNKPANNKEKFSAYEYEVYNKVEFDLNNIDQSSKDRALFKKFQFIFDYIDSTDKKPYLPMFMTESISDFSYIKEPKNKKEIIKATKVSGLPDNSISQFLGDMYQNINIYDNQLEILEKQIVSPISNYGQRYYKYYLVDSSFIENQWCYRLDFKAKYTQDPVLEGYFWVHDTTYAIKKIEATLPERINLNYVRELKMIQEFDQIDGENWMLTKDYMLVDFNLNDKAMGIYGRKTATYKNFVINQPRDPSYFNGFENLIVEKDAAEKSDEYWQEKRHIKLSENESEIYEMVDSLKAMPAFKNIIEIITLVITGYKEVGDNIEIGPYFQMYSWNPIEQHRFRLGFRTTDNWSDRIRFYGHLAYGTGDQRFKYGGGFDAMLSEYPRQIVGASYKNDLEQLGQSNNAFATDNFLSSFLRRVPRNKLTNVEEYNLYVDREWIRGFSTRIGTKVREMIALGELSYISYDETGTEVLQDFIRDANVSAYMRFAYRENFILTGLDRVSLGSEYPIIEMLYTRGFSGIDGSQFNYDIAKMAIKDRLKFGVFGYLDWRLEGGKYFGAFAYPILELHPGNESWFYDNQAFNLMNFFEFASDEYINLFATQHFDGLFFNKIPLLRRLKWREVVTVRGAWGRLDTEKHSEVLKLPENMYSLEYKPYLEGSVGIENIFTIFRVDLLQRFTHLDNPNIATFGVRVRLEIRF